MSCFQGGTTILDADLARLYGVTTARFNEQIRRNAKRFPPDFAFRLTDTEKGELIANCDRFRNLKHSKSLPTAFSEHGAIMAANVLNSEQAIDASVAVVRAFVRMREALAADAEIAAKFGELEGRVDRHDDSIHGIVQVLQQLMQSDVGKKRQIGFRREGESDPE